MKKVLALVLTVVLVLTMSVSAFATVPEVPGPNTDLGAWNPIDNPGLWQWDNPWSSGYGEGSTTGNGAPLGHTRAEIANAIAWELAQRGVVVSDISGIILSMNNDQYAAIRDHAAEAAGILDTLGITVSGDKWHAPLQADLTEEFVTNAVANFAGVIPAGMSVLYNEGSFAINADWITATLTITNTNTELGYSKWARQTVTINWCYTRPDYWNAGTKPPAAGTGTNEGTTGNPLGTQTGDNTVAVALVSLFAVAGVLAIAARKSRNVA